LLSGGSLSANHFLRKASTAFQHTLRTTAAPNLHQCILKLITILKIPLSVMAGVKLVAGAFVEHHLVDVSPRVYSSHLVDAEMGTYVGFG
jgi:hypothetical protein